MAPLGEDDAAAAGEGEEVGADGGERGAAIARELAGAHRGAGAQAGKSCEEAAPAGSHAEECTWRARHALETGR